MNELKNKILEVLMKDERIWDGEMLNENLLKYLADKYDDRLIETLVSNAEIKKNFFKKISDIYIFKVEDFKFFMDENKLDNSYTKYENRIGLKNGSEFIRNIEKVILDFPYKDCILEGGQSLENGIETSYEYNKQKEEYIEKQTNRSEIFFNQILAKDEIDRLFEQKALTNWVRCTKYGIENIDNIKRDELGLIKENLLIKGNNLIALHSLEKEFAGKIKLIYIDPPYNPDSKSNTFCYNNKFNESTWLTFMKNRLEISKRLLKEDGALIVAIDENELFALGMLIKEIFDDYETHCITIVHNPRGVQGTNFSYCHEYAIFVIPKGKKTINNRKIAVEDIKWSNLRNWGSESQREDAKNCFYPIIVNTKTSEIVGFGEVSNDEFHPVGINEFEGELVKIYPVDGINIERKWRYARQTVEEIKHLLRARIKNKVWDIEIGKDFGQYKTVWIDTRYDANEYGTKIVKSLVPECKFDFPKSLWNVYDCIYSVVGNDKNAIVLDFFGGSGTTAHAVLELNKEDNGNRQFILCEQMHYANTVTKNRIHKVIELGKLETSFVYCEIAKWNEVAKDKIVNCNTLEELKDMFNDLYERYFLNYNVNIIRFKEMMEEEDFNKLTLNRQKEMFIKILDLNQMYVNASEMEDEKYEIPKEDIKLTKKFYGTRD